MSKTLFPGETQKIKEESYLETANLFGELFKLPKRNTLKGFPKQFFQTVSKLLEPTWPILSVDNKVKHLVQNSLMNPLIYKDSSKTQTNDCFSWEQQKS
jgi:hypothetical protein